MRKCLYKLKRTGGKKAIPILTALLMVVLLTGVAFAALTGDTACSNHLEHDDSCGYVEARDSHPCEHEHTDDCYIEDKLECRHEHDESCGYAEAEEGHPCEHQCPVCDPAEKIERTERIFDKNPEAEACQDVEIGFQANSDVLSGVALVTEDKDENGSPILAPLAPGEQYRVEEDKVIIKKEYLDTLPETDQNFELEFEGGEQQVEVGVKDTTPQTETETESVEESENANSELETDEKPQILESEEKTSETEEETKEQPKTNTKDTEEQTEKLNHTTEKEIKNGGYSINVSGSNLNEFTDIINFYTFEDGTLTISAEMPIGEKNRVIDIIYPEYGFAVKNPLPNVDGKITAVSTLTDADGRKRVRLSISDSVDETINFQLRFSTTELKYDNIQKQWGATGTLPETGFIVQVSNGDNLVLGKKEFGHWKPENVKEPESFGNGVGMQGYISNFGNDVKLAVSFPVKSGLKDNISRGDVRKIRIYVPNPNLVTVSDFDIGMGYNAGNSISYRYTNKFDISGINSDEEHWWYDIIIKEKDICHNYDANTLNYNWFVITWKTAKVDGAEISPGTIIDVPDAEITIRRYGNEDIRKYKTKLTYTLSKIQESDYFYARYNNEYSAQNPKSVFVNADYVGKDNKIVSVFNGEDNVSNAVYEYRSTHKADPTTEVYEFPYEIQPLAFRTNIVEGDTKMSSYTYITSSGAQFTSSIKANSSIPFDQVPEGERVVKVIFHWDSIYSRHYQFRTSAAVVQGFDFHVSNSHEDGSSIQQNELVQVKHSIETPKSTNKFNTGSSHIWFKILQQECPRFDVVRSLPEDNLLDNQKRVIIDQIKVASGNDLRTSVENPIIRIVLKNYNGMTSNVSKAEEYGYLFTGKMTVMPLMAGWTIQYHTVDQGLQTYQIPDQIPEEGLSIEVPMEEGDRFIGNFAFTKQGWVSGFTPGAILIKDIEGSFPRETDEGELFTKALMGNYMVFPISVYASYADCPSGSHNNEDYFSASKTVEGSVIYLSLYQYRDWRFNIGNPEGKAIMSDGYQGGAASLSTSVNVRCYQQKLFDKDEHKLLHKIDPVLYIEIKNSEIVYAGGTVKFARGKDQNIEDATAEYIETENGKLYLKIGGQEIEELLGSNALAGTVWSGDIDMYILPGAKLGIYPAIGDIYVDLQIDELLQKYNGSAEVQYIRVKAEKLVPDVDGLLEDGDTTTPRLYKYAGNTSNQILQKIFSGVSIIPGAGLNYAMETRKVDFYNNQTENLKGLISIGSANEDLTNYNVIVEIPKKDKRVNGKFPDGAMEREVISAFTMELIKAPKMQANSTGIEPTYTYRLTGSAAWVGEAEITDWSQVDAVKVHLDTMVKNTVLNLELSMRTDRKTEPEPVTSYIGGNYSFISASGINSAGSVILGSYTSRVYSLKGTLWLDRNENGTMDNSEPKANGIAVQVKRISDDAVVDTQVTDANGNYEFILYNGENLYMEIAVEEGQKLTRQTSNKDFTASGADSDFERETNRYVLPSVLSKGTYQNLGAGIVRLPVISAPDVTVAKGKAVKGQAAVASDWTNNPKINYEVSEDEATAIVKTGVVTTNSNTPDTPGWVSGVELGTTKAGVWTENSLGDRVEAEYQIRVVPDVVDFTLGKNLSAASEEEETFVFMMERMDEDGMVTETFYQTIRIPAGSMSSSVSVKGVTPGNYRVTELDANWRYSAVGGQTRTIDMTDSEQAYRVDFTNQKDTDGWVSGKTGVTNTMQEVTP